MAVIKNPDGSITVGIIPEKQPEAKVEKPSSPDKKPKKKA